MDGHQGQHETPGGAGRAVHQPGQDVGGNGGRKGLDGADDDAPDRVLEHQLLLFQGPEQAADGDVETAGRVALAMTDGLLDVVVRDLPQAGNAVGDPALQDRLEAGAVAADAVVAAGLVLAPALAAQDGAPGP